VEAEADAVMTALVAEIAVGMIAHAVEILAVTVVDVRHAVVMIANQIAMLAKTAVAAVDSVRIARVRMTISSLTATQESSKLLNK
jgi:hypothetical protein